MMYEYPEVSLTQSSKFKFSKRLPLAAKQVALYVVHCLTVLYMRLLLDL